MKSCKKTSPGALGTSGDIFGLFYFFMKISRWSVSDFLLLQASLHELSAADRTE